MSKRKLNYCLTIALCFLCTGCWDGLDIERRAIVTLAAVDSIQSQADQPPTVMYTVQIARPSALGGGDKPGPSGSTKNFYVAAGQGENISSALEQTQRNIPRRFFLGHRRILIIGETLAKQGVNSVMDEVVRNPQSRLRTYILVSRNTDAKSLVQLPYPIARLPADALWEMERTGDAVKVDAAHFAAMLLDERDPYAMGVASTTDVSGKDTFQLKDIALFKDDKLVAWLTGNQAEGLAWLVGHLRASTITVRIPGQSGTVSGRLTRIKTRIRPTLKHGQMQLVVTARAVDDIVENGTNQDLRNVKTISTVRQFVNQKVKDDISSTIDALKQNGVDPVGFGRLIHQRYPNHWDALRHRWRTAFKTIPVQVNVQIDVERSGKTGPPLFESEVNHD